MSVKEKSMWQEIKGLRKLWPFLKEYKKYLIFAAVLVPVISALEMNIPIVIRYIIDKGILLKDWDNLHTGVGIYLGLVVFQYLSRSTQAILTGISVHRMIKKLRAHVIDHILKLSCSYHDRSLSGTLVTRATSDFDNLSDSLNTGVLTSVIDIAVLVGSLIGLFYLSWQLTLFALLIFPVVGFVVNWFSKNLKKAMLKARVKIADLNAFTQECLYGSSTIKLLTAEQSATKRYDDLNEAYRKAQMGSVVLDSFMFSIIDGLTSITIGVILYAAITQISDTSAFTAGLMVAFVQYIQQMFEPIKHLSNKIAMLQGAFTAIDRIFGILDTKDFVAGDQQAQRLTGALSFDRVSFSYPGTKQNVLSNVDFSINAGESVAIVGATGSGKSTIIKLLTKLYDGYRGEIYFDQQNLAPLDGRSVRKQIAFVPQDITIFDGSVSFNIGLNQEDDQAIERAAKQVGADQFVHRLAGSYDYHLKEQGANLSQGQKQLIVFARALAKDPIMVILDEATSAIDPESEKLIQTGIEKMLEGRTVIVIAHRLSTIKKCDKILVMDQGKIIEQGNHESLLASRGAYFKLYHSLVIQNSA